MNQLQHHGILGQKRGVRRFQNKDGSLTAAGKKRQLQSEYGRLEDQMTYGKNADKKKNQAIEKRLGELDAELSKKEKSPTSQRRDDSKNRRVMTDAQLKAKIERLKLEKQLRELTDEEVNSGRKYTESILKDIGKQAATKVGSSILAGAALYGAKVLVTKEFDAKELANALFNGGPKKK